MVNEACDPEKNDSFSVVEVHSQSSAHIAAGKRTAFDQQHLLAVSLNSGQFSIHCEWLLFMVLSTKERLSVSPRQSIAGA